MSVPADKADYTSYALRRGRAELRAMVERAHATFEDFREEVKTGRFRAPRSAMRELQRGKTENLKPMPLADPAWRASDSIPALKPDPD